MQEFLQHDIIKSNNINITTGSLVLSAGVMFLAIIITKILAIIIARHFKRKEHSEGRQAAIIQLMRYIIWTFSSILCLQTLGVDITFLIASSAALLVGLGLGMQVIFKDFMSGIIILIDGTIKINDIVEVQDEILKVKEISLRTSKVVTRNDNVVIIPNHKFIEEKVINWTLNTAPTRFMISIGVDYASDTQTVTQCLLQSLSNHPEVIRTKPHAPFVRFENFGSSALEFQLIFWSDNLFRIETTKSDIRYEIVKIFRENNITIPFTQIVLHQA